MKFEDRNNDWLAQEMRREGYRNNKSALERMHTEEENSNDWNAGAIALAKEHAENHALLNVGVKPEQMIQKKGDKVINGLFKFMLFIFFLMQFLGFLSAFF